MRAANQTLYPTGMRLAIALATTFALSLGAPAWAADSPSREQLDFFETKIRPVLATNCYACHSAESKTRMGGLSLDTRDSIREGGLRGHAVVPSDVESSLIVGALRYDGALKMPPTGKLSDEVIADFVKWVEMGAPDPREVRVQQAASTIDLEQGRQYWAFQAPRRSALPSVRDRAWPRGSIDQYVLATIEREGLRPVADASKDDWLRRVTFDLTGLPPAPDEIESFRKDDSSQAYARVVDRLLGSERFGERWGRHWLDVVRYADSVGRTRNLPYPVAWKYRDYVIASLNADKPYDHFVRQQIAGDLLPYASSEERVENQIATGFLALGAHDLNEPDPKQFEMDVVDEMINVTSRSMLALSVGCARCHDHKFDPIPTTDYYALAAIFRGTDVRSGLRRRPRFNAGYFRIQRLVELDGMADYSTPNAAELRAERERLWNALVAAEKDRDRNKCREYARGLGKLPIPENLAMGVTDTGEPVAMKVNIGGDPHTFGEPVDPGFVQALFAADAKLPRIAEGHSGRLQLADWLTRGDNPLTARVMANRVWHHLFGKGLVATVDNFGSTGRAPTNQALLDYLAVQFMDQGWSVKSLVREIALSRTYALSTGFDRSNFDKDPDNDFLWRANLRRLEAESVRDSILMVSGELQTGPPPPSPLNTHDRNQQLNTGNQLVRNWQSKPLYRSVFVPVVRNLSNPLFEAFDFPEPSETHGARDITTGPSQALYLMNNEFVRSQASTAAERLMAARSSDRERVRYAFQQVFSRDPSQQEADSAVGHVRSTVRSLPLETASESGSAEAREWLLDMLKAALGRRPDASEMDRAMEFLVSEHPLAATSVAAAYTAFRKSDGAFRQDVVFQMLSQVMDRQPDRAERADMGKRIRDWRKADMKGGAGNRPFIAAAASPEHEAWSRFYQALFNTAEFRFRN